MSRRDGGDDLAEPSREFDNLGEVLEKVNVEMTEESRSRFPRKASINHSNQEENLINI